MVIVAKHIPRRPRRRAVLRHDSGRPVLRAVGRPWAASVAELIALVVMFASLAILLPLMGLLGAGIASILAYLVSMAWMLRIASRALQISPTVLILPRPSDFRAIAAAAGRIGRRERTRPRAPDESRG